MAVLIDADYQWMKQWTHSRAATKAVLNAWGLTKSEYKAALQEVEDYITNGFSTTPTTSIKAAIEIHTGAATNAQAKQLLNVWLAWSYRQL